MRFLQAATPAELFLSAISIAEIRFGIEQMPVGRKRRDLTHWLTADLPNAFAGRILSVDAVIADTAGRLMSAAKRDGANPQLADGLIAATAKVHGLRLATLNARHYEAFGVELVDLGEDPLTGVGRSRTISRGRNVSHTAWAEGPFPPLMRDEAAHEWGTRAGVGRVGEPALAS